MLTLDFSHMHIKEVYYITFSPPPPTHTHTRTHSEHKRISQAKPKFFSFFFILLVFNLLWITLKIVFKKKSSLYPIFLKFPGKRNIAMQILIKFINMNKQIFFSITPNKKKKIKQLQHLRAHMKTSCHKQLPNKEVKPSKRNKRSKLQTKDEANWKRNLMHLPPPPIRSSCPWDPMRVFDRKVAKSTKTSLSSGATEPKALSSRWVRVALSTAAAPVVVGRFWMGGLMLSSKAACAAF